MTGRLHGPSTTGTRRRFGWAIAAALVAAAVGCSAPGPRQSVPAPATPPTPSPAPTPPTPSPAATPPTPSLPTASPRSPSVTPAVPAPLRFDPAAALADVRALAGEIGPREATGPAYRRAAGHVERRLRSLGYAVRRQPLQVPAGVSWGVGVPAGTTWNVVATPGGADLSAPHVLIGAHLDTVPQAPGAEDNASGVAVLLELARRAATAPPALPVVFVAFAAEEPRGSGDDRHHYGSRRYVAALATGHRRAQRGMLSLDRVGVGERVPVCVGGPAGRPLRRAVLAAATRAAVPVRSCENRASDHWSFEKVGVAGVRLGGTPYPAYHSARDRPGVVRAAQLDRVGRLCWAWLSRPG